MPRYKVYECCICHEVLDYKPIRLVKQKFIEGRYAYGAYQNKHNYDFCDECYKKFNGWVNKNKK